MAASASATALPLPLPDPVATFVAPAGWRSIDVISDLHLSIDTPRGFEAWAAHLRHTDADAVFILGDLFELWVGDDMAERGFEARCAAVMRDAAQHRHIAFMAGNRDFLVGESMLAASGVARLQDPTLVVAFGTRTLFSHGDALCLDDIAYQRYRNVVRRAWAQRAFLGLPLSWRSAIGRLARRRSEASRPPSLRAYADVDTAAAVAWLDAAVAPTLVHGHTHAPRDHALGVGMSRVVLSDWDLDHAVPPRAEVLRWSALGFERIAPATGRSGSAVA